MSIKLSRLSGSLLFRNRFFADSKLCQYRSESKMPKKQNKTKPTANLAGTSIGECRNDVIRVTKQGHIAIHVLAKPGAKHNAISGIEEEGVGIQIAAPPMDGEANTELIKYFSKVLDLRKSDVSLDKGSRSRNKTILVTSAGETVESIRAKIQAEMATG